MFRAARLTAVAFTLAAASAVPFLTAGPAHADIEDCVAYLAEAGYAEEQYRMACGTAAEGNVLQCTEALTNLGVEPGVAEEACSLGASGDEGR